MCARVLLFAVHCNLYVVICIYGIGDGLLTKLQTV